MSSSATVWVIESVFSSSAFSPCRRDTQCIQTRRDKDCDTLVHVLVEGKFLSMFVVRQEKNPELYSFHLWAVCRVVGQSHGDHSLATVICMIQRPTSHT